MQIFLTIVFFLALLFSFCIVSILFKGDDERFVDKIGFFTIICIISSFLWSILFYFKS
jgi:hypothetical protein